MYSLEKIYYAQEKAMAMKAGKKSMSLSSLPFSWVFPNFSAPLAIFLTFPYIRTVSELVHFTSYFMMKIFTLERKQIKNLKLHIELQKRKNNTSTGKHIIKTSIDFNSFFLLLSSAFHCGVMKEVKKEDCKPYLALTLRSLFEKASLKVLLKRILKPCIILFHSYVAPLTPVRTVTLMIPQVDENWWKYSHLNALHPAEHHQFLNLSAHCVVV